MARHGLSSRATNLQAFSLTREWLIQRSGKVCRGFTRSHMVLQQVCVSRVCYDKERQANWSRESGQTSSQHEKLVVCLGQCYVSGLANVKVDGLLACYKCA